MEKQISIDTTLDMIDEFGQVRRSAPRLFGVGVRMYREDCLPYVLGYRHPSTIETSEPEPTEEYTP